ncbi:hypothetical protein B5M09_011243 [Aphanomyces astaci]|uniref:Uncharacterized protein n=1 Tax=Aphanomyces astaci TaxID=112090 RepID=A0A3R8D3S3_APHAT|nr:hypothetical protein B5M09_011243 [Aphanomyces astaci]
MPHRGPDSKYKPDTDEVDDLVALSYIQLSVHNDHLKYIQHVDTTCDTWNALKTIYENTSEVSLVTLQMKMYKLNRSERIGLESFPGQFQELTRKMTAAVTAPLNGRTAPEELKLDDERQKLSNSSLRKNADRSDDALNATANGKCH